MSEKSFIKKLSVLLLAAVISLTSFGGYLPWELNTSVCVEAASKDKTAAESILVKYNGQTLLKPKTSYKKIKWISKDESVATVDKNGKVRAVGHGKTTVIAKLKTGKNKTKKIKYIINVPYTFANDDLLEDHFEKHGREMGIYDPGDYQRAAAAVIANPDSLHKTEAEDGDDVYFLESTGELVVVSTWGFIRTYFIPEDGIEYYNRT